MGNEKILVVDDEKSMREFLRIFLEKEGYEVRCFSDGRLAVESFKENAYDLAISDLRMEGMDGVTLLKELKDLDPHIPVLMITAYASIDTAIEAMKLGAYDYFTKPFKVNEIKIHIRRALERSLIYKENLLLKKDLKVKYGFAGLIGTSEKMKELYKTLMSVAPTKANVLITGKSGTGKELVARAIHQESDRSERPFVALNCGAIPHNLIESELFGHQRGAFTGAVTQKEGLFEMAGGGTLFLDEVTELPLDLQVKLLRFIQERTLRRVGGTADISVDTRLVAASNREMEEEVREGKFREDLFYRLNVIRINVPSLKERKEDIVLLANHFLDKYSARLDKKVERISEGAIKLLLGYDYSGNVRELENIIERAVTLEESPIIRPESLPSYLSEYEGNPLVPVMPGAGSKVICLSDGSSIPSFTIPADGIDLEEIVNVFEQRLIADAMEKADGVKTKAAELLGMSFRSFRYKLSKYDNR